MARGTSYVQTRTLPNPPRHTATRLGCPGLAGVVRLLMASWPDFKRNPIPYLASALAIFLSRFWAMARE
jgi:hypothetical protein